MKKFFALLIAILMLCVACACVDSTPTNENESVITQNNSSVSDANNNQSKDQLSSKTESATCTHEKTTIKDNSNATCTENGYTGDTYCNVCNKMIKSGFTIKATGHNKEIRNKKEATYISVGYTGDTYCKTCNIKLESGKTIPKLENNNQENTSKTVYITETGKRYHSTKHCTGLNNAKAIYDSTLSNAQKLGLTPCSKCY